MVHSRFSLVIPIVILGLGWVGCSQRLSSEAASPEGENAGQAAAKRPGRVVRTVQWWQDESIVAKLQLTDDQVVAIDELMVATAHEAVDQRKQERQVSLRYLRALAQDPYDPELVDMLSGRLIEVLASEHRRRIDNVHRLRDILTREQWTKLWEVAPEAVKVGRFQIVRGPAISVTGDPGASQSPTP